MKPDHLSLEDQIAQLPDRDRARLALRLLESLEPGSDENVDGLWLDEAERRLENYDKGLTDARDVEEAIAEIEHQLR